MLGVFIFQEALNYFFLFFFRQKIGSLIRRTVRQAKYRETYGLINDGSSATTTGAVFRETVDVY